MTTIRELADAWIASREHHTGSIGRIQFWVSQFGDTAVGEVTEADVDRAVQALVQRGKLRGGRGCARVPTPTGEPLAGSTVNRFVSTLSGLYRYARHLRVLPRSHTPPTKGIEKAPEPVDPEKYFRPDEVDRLVAVARVVDSRWGKLPALIILGFHTGLRVGSLMKLRWRDINLKERTAFVAVTKNGRPHVAVLTQSCVDELTRLREGEPDELVFGSRFANKPYHYRRVWQRACAEAGFTGRTFHWLRHGCGSALAESGANQAQIMSVMGHRTLTASARYMHNNVEDRRRVVEGVFR
ncbi:MAG: site-specific integrase [Pseudomonadota bacterium]